MAILITFGLVAADERQVEYAYGPSEAEFDRRVVIDLEHDEVRPRDDDNDHAAYAVVHKAGKLHAETGVWPRAGMYAA